MNTSHNYKRHKKRTKTYPPLHLPWELYLSSNLISWMIHCLPSTVYSIGWGQKCDLGQTFDLTKYLFSLFRLFYTCSKGTLMLQHLTVNLTERKWYMGGFDSQLSKTIQMRMTNSLQSNPCRNPRPPLPHQLSTTPNKDLPRHVAVDVNPDLGELLDVGLQPGAPHLLLHLPHLLISVLQSGMFIPDLGSEFFPSRTPDPHQRI